MKVERFDIALKPDPKRVLYRPFWNMPKTKLIRIMARIQSLSEKDVTATLKKVMTNFHKRHQKLDDFLMHQYYAMEKYLIMDSTLSEERKLLIGAFFTHEYSLESSALFNPSMIWHPDQSEVEPGSKRFIVSLRAVGEGHVSSISFRSGIIDSNFVIKMDEPSPYVNMPEQNTEAPYEKKMFIAKLEELGLMNKSTDKVMDNLEDYFTIDELKHYIKKFDRQVATTNNNIQPIADGILSLAQSNYSVYFADDVDISQRIIFPYTAAEINGIEDARFVEFRDENNELTYYAIYTAYDGKVILPQMLETKDFKHFQISTLNGPAISNKGMALFPRKINGRYYMISRQDNENIFIMSSDNIHFWYDKDVLMKPSYPWEFIQLGNCGSPIETDRGWLLLTHGVGPMREYTIGAVLLDIDNPEKVIGRMKEPLISPNKNEREGYVPNVVYSCGGQLYKDRLIVPYAMADYASSFISVNTEELLDKMV